MRGSLLILLFFVSGIILAFLNLLPEELLQNDPTLYALWLLMALVGLSLGADEKLVEILKSTKIQILLLPLCTTIGTFLGSAIAPIFINRSLPDCLAVGSGFAYYSLSSIFIGQYKGPELGAIALIANISRELFTLLFVPLVFKYFGPWAAISCGGASTVDTTLPIIGKTAGKMWIFPAIIHGVCLDFCVPFWVTFFCSL